MQTYFPSQVVSFLDAIFPFARDHAEGMRGQVPLGFQDAAAAVGHLIHMIDGIPNRLLRFDGVAESEFGQAFEALKMSKAIWASGRTDHFLPNVHTQKEWQHPLAIVRKHLAALVDDVVEAAVDRLAFVSEPALKAGLSRDLAAADSALDRGEWKSATVLAGSVVEALLLDVLLRCRALDEAGFLAAEKQHAGKFQGKPLEDWDLHHLTATATALNVVTKDTATACGLMKNFRNLIHPGRGLRLAQECNRPSALSAVGAMEHVIHDLSRST
jgi:hypothetical protein